MFKDWYFSVTAVLLAFEKPNMATTHQVAMITNSCFKSAVNPKTGLVSSTNAAEESALGASWFGRDADYLDDGRDTPKMHLSKSVNFDTTNSMMDTMNGVDLSELTDEQFYERLSSLKADHKRTLALCERLYNEKLSEVRTGTAPVDNRQVPIASVDSNYMLTAPITQTMNGVSSSAELLQHRDHVRDMSASKPPIGKPRKSPGTPGKSGGKQAWARRSSEDFWKSQSMQSGRSSDAEMSGDEGDRSRTPLDRSLEALNASRASYMSHIEDMWDNFSVDEYAPRDKTRMGPRSSSMSRLPTSSAEEKSLTESQEWRNRITVPKPFKMTLREANKTPTKSKTMQELEEQRDEQQRREEAECQKRFKAKPVPAHVYMPLFQEVMENQETKRRYVQKATADMLMSMQKPFKFDIREKEKKKYRRTQSTPDNSDLNKKPKTTFKAKPFPAHIFDNDVNDRMKEEEEYRKIRCQMRSEELIRSSSLPPNMAAKGREYTEGKSRQKVHAERAKKAGMTPEHKFRPYVNDTVPDFEQLHRQFLHEAMKKKNQREATVCKPFKMNAGNSATKRHKIYDQSMSETEDSIKENKSPFRRSKFRPVCECILIFNIIFRCCISMIVCPQCFDPCILSSTSESITICHTNYEVILTNIISIKFNMVNIYKYRDSSTVYFLKVPIDYLYNYRFCILIQGPTVFRALN